jgi:hypothetical protein
MNRMEQCQIKREPESQQIEYGELFFHDARPAMVERLRLSQPGGSRVAIDETKNSSAIKIKKPCYTNYLYVGASILLRA